MCKVLISDGICDGIIHADAMRAARYHAREESHLTDTKLRNLKAGEKLFKVTDHDGLYVAVTPAGWISFRYNYSINGRRETLMFGRYGLGSISLAEARKSFTHGPEMVNNATLISQ